jgi:hypothetical protein
MTMRVLADPHQADMFSAPVFAPRARAEMIDADRFRLRLKMAMSASALNCGRSRESIAAEMARMLRQPSLSKGMLDAYTSPAKDHDISLIRFKAFARATQAASLWDVAVSDEGLLILQGDEPRLAEIARLQQLTRGINAEIRRLMSAPVAIRRG